MLRLISSFYITKEKQITQQHASNQYLFGTLETANGAIFDQKGLSYAQVARQEHTAGVNVANITLAWKDYEIAEKKEINNIHVEFLLVFFRRVCYI